MKLDPRPQPASCDRCGKVTTKYQEMVIEEERLKFLLEEPNDALPEEMAVILALSHGINDACLSCWSIIQSCVTRAGQVQARKAKAK